MVSLERSPVAAIAARRPAMMLGLGCVLALVLAAPALAQSAPAPAPAPVAVPQVPPVSLPEALALAYEKNPDLNAARAQLRATDEGPAIVRAQGLPSLQAAAQFNHMLDKGLNNPTLPTDTLSGTGSFSVPIYQGGTIRNGIAAAKQRVVAGRHDLDAVEANVFTQVVAAYLSVIRDEAVVGLNQKNVDALGVNLKATDARFQKGDLTKTDVAQSNQRLEQARAQLLQAQVQLDASRERYVRLVGAAPGPLAPPQPLVGLPISAEDAIDIAMRNNPDLLAAEIKARAAHYDTNSAYGQRLPKISGFGSYSYSRYSDPYFGAIACTDSSGVVHTNGPTGCYNHEHTASVGAQITIPLYQGGGPAAEIRRAQALEGQALENANSVNRAVVETARDAFYAWRASSAIIAASENAVASAEQSLLGVRAENKIGTRTIIDLLNAEQELLSTQVQLVSARRDAYIAAFNLLAAMGQAQARNLGIDADHLYDSTAHYRRVGGSIWDWGSDPTPVAQSSTTTVVPIQDGLLR